MQSGDPEHAMGEDAAMDRADNGSNICTINDDLGIRPSDQAHESQDERSEEALPQQHQSLDGASTGEPVEEALDPQLLEEECFEQGPLSQGPYANFFERPSEISYRPLRYRPAEITVEEELFGAEPFEEYVEPPRREYNDVPYLEEEEPYEEKPVEAESFYEKELEEEVALGKREVTIGVRFYDLRGFCNRMIDDAGDFTIEALGCCHAIDKGIITENTRRAKFIAPTRPRQPSGQRPVQSRIYGYTHRRPVARQQPARRPPMRTATTFRDHITDEALRPDYLDHKDSSPAAVNTNG